MKTGSIEFPPRERILSNFTSRYRLDFGAVRIESATFTLSYAASKRLDGTLYWETTWLHNPAVQLTIQSLNSLAQVRDCCPLSFSFLSNGDLLTLLAINTGNARNFAVGDSCTVHALAFGVPV